MLHIYQSFCPSVIVISLSLAVFCATCWYWDSLLAWHMLAECFSDSFTEQNHYFSQGIFISSRCSVSLPKPNGYNENPHMHKQKLGAQQVAKLSLKLQFLAFQWWTLICLNQDIQAAFIITCLACCWDEFNSSSSSKLFVIAPLFAFGRREFFFIDIVCPFLIISQCWKNLSQQCVF